MILELKNNKIINVDVSRYFAVITVIKNNNFFAIKLVVVDTKEILLLFPYFVNINK